MKTIITTIACMFFTTLTFSQSTDFDNYRILEVGSISIPNNMEIQSGNYKKKSEIYQKEISKKFGFNKKG